MIRTSRLEYMTNQVSQYAMNMVDGLQDYFGPTIPDEQVPATIRLPEYPGELIQRLLANDSAHPLIVMSHVDRRGFPFMSVMGFTLIDGKVHIPSRNRGLKLRRLTENPRASVCYHSNIACPEGTAALTMVGQTRLSRDPAIVHEANVILSHKVYRDTDPEVERREGMIRSMDEADRTVIVFDKVEGVYLRSPTMAGLPDGRPGPVLSWSNDRTS